MVQEFLKPVIVDEEEMGFTAMAEVGPGGHFFGAQHTLARYSAAFYQPLISDWRNYPSWDASGRPTAEKKANALWKQALAEYRPPPLDPGALEAIDSFVARRVSEGGEKTDF
jgi:trimethylamine--corrinoid protein Co-methyltransferase